jgi:hypothetical protein
MPRKKSEDLEKLYAPIVKLGMHYGEWYAVMPCLHGARGLGATREEAVGRLAASVAAAIRRLLRRARPPSRLSRVEVAQRAASRRAYGKVLAALKMSGQDADALLAKRFPTADARKAADSIVEALDPSLPRDALLDAWIDAYARAGGKLEGDR